VFEIDDFDAASPAPASSVRRSLDKPADLRGDPRE
jgi:hypothetical protein